MTENDNETDDNDIDDLFRADEVQKILNRLKDETNHTKNTPEAIKQFTTKVVEKGTFTPYSKVNTKVPLTIRERFIGEAEQDVTPMLIIGMILGSALERDVPMNSSLEDAWRNGEFELPDKP